MRSTLARIETYGTETAEDFPIRMAFRPMFGVMVWECCASCIGGALRSRVGCSGGSEVEPRSQVRSAGTFIPPEHLGATWIAKRRARVTGARSARAWHRNVSRSGGLLPHASKDCRARLEELIEARRIRVVQVEGWRDPAYLHVEAKAPRSVAAATLRLPSIR